MIASPTLSHRVFTRRNFLAAGLACPVCAHLLGARDATADTAADTAVDTGAKPHWTYEGAQGPEHWGDLSADFKTCRLGLQQTPVDLQGGTRVELAAVAPSFKKMKLKILNNGYTIQVNCEKGSSTAINGEIYELRQFHFHHPSEHLLSGKAFDLELHFVHKSAAGRLAVLGVFIQPGAENAALKPIWAAMPRKAGKEKAVDVSIAPAGLVPAERGFFRYRGSLTTPPCSEGVLWTVFRQPITASTAQIEQFAKLFPANARPAQPLNQRFLLESS